MAAGVIPDLGALAERIREARPRGFVDLYLTRTAEVWWRVAGGVVTARRELLREGAAVRSAGTFRSSDGLDRLVLADLLGITARTLPALAPAPFPPPPDIGPLAAELGATGYELHWRGGWAVLLADGRETPLRRPELLEVLGPDGQRFLYSWPLAPGWSAPQPAPAPAGPVRPGHPTVLLAPAPAAVLFHELLAHPLEGDLLVRGSSPLAGRQGARLFPIPVDVDDDPTAASLPGSFSADDEGVAARRRLLVRDGVLVGMLCDRASAIALGGKPGNARRATVHTPPRPRVSNLVIRCRRGDADALRREAAVEVTSLASGSVEPRLGLVTLAVRSAWALRRGARVQPLAPFVLAGTIADVLGGVRALAGPSVATAEPGWCSKDGEIVPTGAIAPFVLLAGVEAR
jgi:predicted Zn-dependent protease